MKVYFEQADMLAFATAMMNKEESGLKLVGKKSEARALDLQMWLSGKAGGKR